MSEAERGVGTIQRTGRLRPAGDEAGPAHELVAAPRRAGRAAWRLIIDGRLVSVLVIIGIWQLTVIAFGISPVAMPGPAAVATSWWDVLLHGDLVGALGVSLEATLIGFGISVLVGVPVGLGMGLARRFRYVVDPYVTILLATPYSALVPVLLVWTGLGMKTQVTAAFLLSVPFVTINAEAGVRDVDSSIVSMARSFETPNLQFFRKVVLPGALSSIFIGLRLGMSHGFKGVIIAEILVSYAGLGGLANLYGAAFRTDHLLAVIITALAAVLFINGTFSLLYRQLLPWRREQR